MKNSEDDGLFEAIQRYAERLSWLSAGTPPGEGLPADKLRLLLAEWDETLEPWRKRTRDAKMRSELNQLALWVAKGRARLRLSFLIALHKLVEMRFKWLMWEKALQVPGRVKKILEANSPAEREKMLSLARQMMGKDFDPAGMFQEAMENADGWEADWQQSLRSMKREWEEEFTAETEQRLRACDAPAAALWMAELIGDMTKIITAHPELG